jgi:hypothetical protein
VSAEHDQIRIGHQSTFGPDLPQWFADHVGANLQTCRRNQDARMWQAAPLSGQHRRRERTLRRAVEREG